MEILNKTIRRDEFSTIRARYGKAGEVVPAGTIIAIERSQAGREEFMESGGLTNLKPLGIPDRASYEIILPDVYAAADGEKVLCEAGDKVEFTADQALSLMKNGGRIRPTDPSVTDIGFYVPGRYLKQTEQKNP